MDGTCFDSYLSFGSPFPLGPPWDFVPAEPQAYTGPADPAAALAALRGSYPESLLIEAGIAQRNVGGCLEIHPFLARPCTPVIALRDKQRGWIDNLMTDAGCVRGYRYPLFAALLDEHCCRALATTCHELILTDNLVDAIILRSLGFAAAPIVGLSELDSYGLGLLTSLFGVRRNVCFHGRDDQCESRAPALSERTERQRAIYAQHDWWSPPRIPAVVADDHGCLPLLIANWSPSAVSFVEPTAIHSAVSYLRDLGSYRSYDLFPIKVWTPGNHAVEALKFAVANREDSWVKSAVFESLESDVGSLTATVEGDTPIDLAAAFDGMHRSLLNGTDNATCRRRRQESLVAYRSAMQQAIVGPLVCQMGQATDPIQRTKFALLVNLCTVVEDLMLQWREHAYAAARMMSHEHEADNNQKVSQILAIKRQILRLVKELESKA